MKPATSSEAELLASLPEPERLKILTDLTDEQYIDLAWDWGFWGRPDQQLPEGDWFVWLVLAGRGYGKTRLAVENIARLLRGPSPLVAPPDAPAILSIIADTPFDMRQYAIEGPSGFLNVGPPDYRPEYEPSKKTMTWPNGCKALLFSAEDPETLRGASGSFFWWDELAKSRYAREGWDNMLFGMREGNPRGIVTTTPRPIALIKELIAKPSTKKTIGSTWDNRNNLSPVFYREVIEPLVGTRLGRQEIEAEILDEIPGALWTRAGIDGNRKRANEVPDLQRVVVGVDPATASPEGIAEGRAETGIIVAGLGVDGRGYVLADLTCRLGPDGWARRAISGIDLHSGDAIVAETNQGGAMVKNTIRSVRPTVKVIEVHASRGKVTRAEPISALYEQGRVSHVGTFAELEDQMMLFTPYGIDGNTTADRVDALVWALTALFPKMLQSQKPKNDGSVRIESAAGYDAHRFGRT